MFKDDKLEGILIDYQKGIVEPVFKYCEQFEEKKNSLYRKFGPKKGILCQMKKPLKKAANLLVPKMIF